jgi:hypothetical protein
MELRQQAELMSNIAVGRSRWQVPLVARTASRGRFIANEVLYQCRQLARPRDSAPGRNEERTGFPRSRE